MATANLSEFSEAEKICRPWRGPARLRDGKPTDNEAQQCTGPGGVPRLRDQSRWGWCGFKTPCCPQSREAGLRLLTEGPFGACESLSACGLTTSYTGSMR